MERQGPSSPKPSDVRDPWGRRRDETDKYFNGRRVRGTEYCCPRCNLTMEPGLEPSLAEILYWSANPPGHPQPSVAAYFWSLVDRSGPQQSHMPTPCWVWTGDSDPYGLFWHPSCSLKRATRFVLEMLGETLVDEVTRRPFLACHHCDNPPCVRPDHLYVGTHKTNTADMLARGRHVITTKLTEADVLEIRRLRADGLSASDVARRFNVTSQNISIVASGRSWKRVGGPRT